MTKQQQEKFKKLLEEKRVKIERELKSISVRNPNVEGDWQSKFPKFDEDSSLEEASDEVEEFITRLPIEQSFETTLKSIEEALERIKKGGYGICSNCKKNIPTKRLEVLPETDRCLKCKK